MSALPLRTTSSSLNVGVVTVVSRFVASIGCQVVPSLFESVYWLVLTLVLKLLLPEGSTLAVNRASEYGPPLGPAPALMLAPIADLLVFQTTSTLYVVDAAM